jgi:hypothetical protein
MRKQTWGFVALAIVGGSLVGGWSAALACPFCTAVSQTFSEEINTMDVAVIARLVKVPPQSDKPGDEIAKATFEVAQVIKGGRAWPRSATRLRRCTSATGPPAGRSW